MKPDKKTILLVEDEALIAVSETKHLQKYGYDVIIAPGGFDAIDAVRSNAAIDLILMDIDLGPGMDGTEAAAIILREREVPVVFLSSHTEPEVVEKTEKITSYGYVVKNSGITVLDASIKMAFKLFEAHRKIEHQKEEIEAANEELTVTLEEMEATNEEQRKLNETLNAIVYSSPLAIISIDAHSNVTQWNPAAERMFGWSEFEVMGRFLPIVPEDKIEEHRALRHRVMRGEASENIEACRLRKDGTSIDISISTAPLHDSMGRIVGIVSVSADITGRKKAEESMMEKEERLQLLSDNLTGGMVYQIDSGEDGRQRRFSFIGNTIEQLHEITAAEAEKDAITIYGQVVETDSDTVVEKEARALETMSSFSAEIKFRLPSGRIRWGLLTSTPRRLPNNHLVWDGIEIDITERKRAEEELCISEERLRNLVDNSIDIIYRMKLPECTYEYINSAVTAISGYTPEDYYRDPLLLGKIVHPDWADYLEREWRNMLMGNVPPSYEFQIIHKSGETKWVNQRSLLIRNGSGIPIAIEGIVQDVTERKKMENALRESEEKYRLMHENSGIAVGYYRPDCTVISYNRLAAQNMNGVPGDFNGKSIYDIFPKQDAEFYHERIKKAILSDAPVAYEDLVRLPSGYRYLISTFTRMVDKNNNVLGIQIISQDITERKRAEEALRESEARAQAMLRAIPDLMFRMDRQGIFLDYKADISDLYAQSEATIIGKRNRDLTPPEFADLIDRQIHATLATGILQTFEYQLPIPGRGLRYYEARMSASGADEVMTIARDITERKNAEDTVKSLLAEKDLLLRETHHRIKNNLATIASLLDLQAEDANDAIAAALTDAKDRLRSMGVLYNKLYRSDNLSSVSMEEYLPSLADEIAGNFPGKAAMEYHIEEFRLDAKTVFPLGIILYELITNTMKYAFPGKDGGVITMSATMKDGRATISIGDNGIGIPETMDIERSPGFGLQLVGILTKQIGGTMKIHKGKGTRYELEFNA